jgi:periplasmic protein TonB
MFDLTSGTIDRPFRDKHASASVVSVMFHATLAGGIVGALLFGASNELPRIPTMMAFVADLAAPPPPPPPPPAQAPRVRESKPQPTTHAQASGQLFSAPVEIPQGIQPDNAVDFDEEGGVAGGVPGGIAGGVVGGLLGGRTTDVPPPPPPAPRAPKRIGGDIQTPALIHRVEPEYPAIAVKAKITGVVILEATVDEAGEVTDVAVLRSLPLLDKSAVNAVKQWRYQPLLLNGARYPFILTVTLTFSLR